MSEQHISQLCIDYAAALERLRRHRRTMRENRCPMQSEDGPCWINLQDGSLGMDEICDECLMRQVAYHFRHVAVMDVGKLRRKIERWAKKATKAVTA